MPQKLLQLLRTGELQRRYADLIKVVPGPDDLLLFNYTDLCQQRRLWDDVTLLCRGLVLNQVTGEVVARPFAKFFNWHEYKEEIPKESFEVTEKVDGSLGILYRHQGHYGLCTRGSFTSVQARRGTQLLQQKLAGRALPEELTFLFEVILPDVGSTGVKYDFEGLFLLGAINRFSGEELPSSEVEEYATRFGFRLPVRYRFSSPEEVLTARSTLPANLEGFVLRFESGLRLKLKSEAYLEVLRTSSGLSRNRVLTALAQGEESYKALLQETPEECWPFAEAIASSAREEAQRLKEAVMALFEKAPKESRKDLALWAQQNAPPPLRSALFLLFNNKEPSWLSLVVSVEENAKRSSP